MTDEHVGEYGVGRGWLARIHWIFATDVDSGEFGAGRCGGSGVCISARVGELSAYVVVFYIRRIVIITLLALFFLAFILVCESLTPPRNQETTLSPAGPPLPQAMA